MNKNQIINLVARILNGVSRFYVRWSRRLSYRLFFFFQRVRGNLVSSQPPWLPKFLLLARREAERVKRYASSLYSVYTHEHIQGGTSLVPASISAQKPIIKIENTSVIYQPGKSNEVWGAKNVSLEIYPEEYIILFGPSGSGKSTILNLIAGLEKPVSGKVIVADHDLGNMEEQQLINFHRNTTGIIFQAFYLISHLSIRDNILLPQIFMGVAKEEREKKLIEMARRFQIEDIMEQKPNELSGGQQQRVAAARALINDPEIILADEPVGNLDSKNAQITMQLLQELNQKDRKTVILVTHDPRYIPYADRVFYMKDGQKEKETRNYHKLRSGKQAMISEQEKLAQLFPYAEENKLRAKLIVSQVLQPLSYTDLEKIESAVEQLLSNKISEETLYQTLTDKKGPSFYTQTAKKATKAILGLASEMKVLEKPKEPSRKMDQRVISLRRFLLDRYESELSLQQIHRLDVGILSYLNGKITIEELRHYLDLSFTEEGVGLNKRTAKNFIRQIETLTGK